MKYVQVTVGSSAAILIARKGNKKALKTLNASGDGWDNYVPTYDVPAEDVADCIHFDGLLRPGTTFADLARDVTSCFGPRERYVEVKLAAGRSTFISVKHNKKALRALRDAIEPHGGYVYLHAKYTLSQAAAVLTDDDVILDGILEVPESAQRIADFFDYPEGFVA